MSFMFFIPLLPVELYEEARRFGKSASKRAAFARIAVTFSEVGPCVRFIPDMSRRTENRGEFTLPREMDQKIA